MRFVADLDFRVAFEHDVELVLAGVRVRGVLLAGFETIEPGEQGLAARDGRSSPFSWEENSASPARCLTIIRAYAVAATPSFLYQGVAPLSAAFTALMFFTPFVESKSSSAFTPLVA